MHWVTSQSDGKSCKRGEESGWFLDLAFDRSLLYMDDLRPPVMTIHGAGVGSDLQRRVWRTRTVLSRFRKGRTRCLRSRLFPL